MSLLICLGLYHIDDLKSLKKLGVLSEPVQGLAGSLNLEVEEVNVHNEHFT